MSNDKPPDTESCAYCNSTLAAEIWHTAVFEEDKSNNLQMYVFCDEKCLNSWQEEKPDSETRFGSGFEAETEHLKFVNQLLRHELLNSINVVQSRLEIIKSYSDPEAVSHHEVATERLTNMRQLLELSRELVESIDRDQPDTQPVNLEEILTDTVDRMNSIHNEAVFEIDDSPDITVEADTVIEYAFENILRNAVKHNDTPEPRITIDAKQGVTLSDNDAVLVRIRDNGPGITETVRETIFEGELSTPEELNDSRGLYLVRGIIEQYNGKIDVKTSDGTIVDVVLPVAK